MSRTATATAPGWRGGKQAKELAAFADGRAQSAAETLARHRVRERGLPPGVPQYEIRDAHGRKRLLDLAFVEQWTALEPDGKVKYDQPYGNPSDVRWDEKLRVSLRGRTSARRRADKRPPGTSSRRK